MNKLCTYCLLLIVFFFCFACTNSIQYKQVSEDFSETISTASKEDIDSIINTIPSYSEIAKQMQTAKIQFSEKAIIDYHTADLYQNSKETALALGMFTADLGYIRHYEKVQLCSDFLEAIQVLATKLAVGEDIFAQYTSHIEANINNEEVIFTTIDSLLSEKSLVPVENEKYGISALFIAGFWIEITHLGLLQEISNDNSDKLANHFQVLTQINNLLDKISDNEIISTLKEQMLELENKGYNSPSLTEDVEKIRNEYVKSLILI